MFTQPDIHRNSGVRRWRLVAAALVFCLQPLTAQLGLGLSPMRAELRMTPGAVYTGTLRLVNEGAAVHVRTSLLDFHLDAEQTPQFENEFPAEAAYSCRRWVTVNPMETDLGAAGHLMVRYTLRVPADAQERSYYCAIGFTTMPPPQSAGAMGLQTSVRVVAALYVIVGAPPIQGQLSSIGVEQAPGTKDLRAVVVLENSGRMFFRPNGSVEILDPGGKVLEQYEMTPVPILPERKQRLLFPLKQMAQGQPGQIRVRVDIGGGEIQEGTAVIAATSLQ